MNTGTVIDGRYRVLKPLGQGGMGSVFLVEDLELEKRLALKTLLPQLASDARSVEMLKREVRLAQELHHPNICAMFHFQQSAGAAYIVMEYVEGCTLSDYIFSQSGHRFKEDAFRHIAEQIAAGVAYAHEAGIIHRDLKAGNIMVADGGRVRIMDFGIAASLKEVYARTTGSPVTLSVHYASPEQINGEAPSISMDIYSLGCVFYEMLAGAPPFTRGDVLYQQLTRMPEPISGVSPALNGLILACLQKDPALRPVSARMLLDAISGRTIRISTRPAHSASYRARPAGFRTSWKAGIGLLGVALAVSAGLAIWWPRKSNVPMRPAETHPSTPASNVEPAALRPFSANPLTTGASSSAPAPLSTKPQPVTSAAPQPQRGDRELDVGSVLAHTNRLLDRGLYADAIRILDSALEKEPANALLIAARQEALRAREAERRVRERLR